MKQTPPSVLQEQVARAHRRLFWQTWLNSLPFYWAAFLILAAAWLLVQPLLLGVTATLVSWTIVAGALLVGTGLAVAFAWFRAPSRTEAALDLDQRFALKERTTTALTLSDEQVQSSAGQALLADVSQQLAKINIPSRFPLSLSWRRGLLPIAAAVLAVLALNIGPALRPNVVAANSSDQLDLAKADAIQKARADAKKKLEENKKQGQGKSKEIEALELKMEQVFDKDVDPKSKEDNRKQVQDIQELEKENNKLIKDAQTALLKKDELEKQINAIDDLLTKDKDNKGPAKDLLDALQKGDSKKAEEELQKLRDRLAKNQLTDEEKQQLAEQMEKMQKQAEQMAQQQKELQKLMEEAKNAGELSEEQMKELARRMRQLEDFEVLEAELRQCRECIRDREGAEAAEKLGKVGKALQALAGQKQDLQKEMNSTAQKGQGLDQLKANQQMLQEARQAICQNLGMGGNGPPGGPRPSKQTDTNAKDAPELADIDKQGQFKITGVGPVMPGSKTVIPFKDVPDAFQKTAQKAQQAIQRQPISPEAAELLKGYYENLSNQKKQ
jgi:hypothetical protein